MNHICKYASSGCNGPKEGECVGLCEVKAKHTPLFMTVDIGDGASMFIANPTKDPSACHCLIFPGPSGVDDRTRLSASAIIESFDYLLSDSINMTEAVRRVRLMRSARRAAIAKATGSAA
jgi:hypothetical protein